MHVYLSYFVSVLCAVIAGFSSYAVTRKQANADMQKLQTAHEFDIEKEWEKFKNGKRESNFVLQQAKVIDDGKMEIAL